MCLVWIMSLTEERGPSQAIQIPNGFLGETLLLLWLILKLEARKLLEEDDKDLTFLQHLAKESVDDEGEEDGE